jgi:hypothetical protein
MSAVLVLLMIGVYKKNKEDSSQDIVQSENIKQPEETPQEQEIYYEYYYLIN